MRGNLSRKLPHPNSFLPTCRHSFSTFDPSGAGGRGRGRGGAGTPSPFSPVPPPAPDDDRPMPPPGRGHGRGIPASPSFSNFGSPIGRGRGGPAPGGSSKPIFFKREDGIPPPMMGPGRSPDSGQGRGSDRGIGLPASIASVLEDVGRGRGGAGGLPESITSVLQGSGRGKPVMQPKVEGPPVKEENRHLRARPLPPSGRDEGPRRGPGTMPRGREDGGRGSGSRGRGRGVSARGGRGRGRGRGWGRGFRDFRDRGGDESDAEDGYAAGLHLGDNEDGEKLAERIGPENMNKLVEGFEEMSEFVLPSPTHEMYLDAFHTNCLVS